MHIGIHRVCPTTEARTSRRMRRAGKAPGIVYGGTHAPQPIELDHNALFHALRNEAFHASILTMSLDGKTTKVLLRDVQMHPFKNEILHVDFQRIDENRKIHMKVPLHFVNGENSPAVKTSGAIVSHVLTELDISCLPKDLPEFIAVDLSALDVGHSVHVSALELPPGVVVATRGKLGPVVASASSRRRRSRRRRRPLPPKPRPPQPRPPCPVPRLPPTPKPPTRRAATRRAATRRNPGRTTRRRSKHLLSPPPARGPVARIPAGLFSLRRSEAANRLDGHIFQHLCRWPALTPWHLYVLSQAGKSGREHVARATTRDSGSPTAASSSAPPSGASKFQGQVAKGPAICGC